jgi:hypothetical protein
MGNVSFLVLINSSRLEPPPHPARLQWHGLQNNDPCAFYNQVSKSIHHLLVGCNFSRETWFKLLWVIGFHHLTLAMDD